MQLPGKYKENIDVSSEGPSSGVTSLVKPDKGLYTSKFSLYFSGSCIPTNESLLLVNVCFTSAIGVGFLQHAVL